MATIASLDVALRAQTRQFRRGMKLAQRQTRETAESIQRAGRLVKGFATALVATVTISAFAGIINRSRKALDAMAKLADRTGIAVDELQALERAASLAGVDSSTVAAALDVMQKRLGEAARGAGAARKALEEIGLSAEDLIKLDPAAQMRAIADGIAGLDTKSQRAAATANIFSRANQKLLNLLEGGGDAIEESRRKIAEWRLTLTRLDLTRVEAATNAIDDLRRIASLTFDRLTVELAPFIEASAKQLIAWGTSGEGAGRRVVNAFEEVGAAVALTIDAVRFMGASFRGVFASLELGIATLGKGFVALADGIKLLGSKFGVRLGNEDLERVRRVVDDFFDSAAERQIAAAKTLGDQLEVFQGTGKFSRQFRAMIAELRKDAERFAKIIEEEAKKRAAALGDAAELVVVGLVKMHWPDSFEQLGVRVTAAGRSVRVELTRGPQKRTAPG